jgi:hypothetical protein
LAEFDREIKKPGGQRVEANGAPAGKIRSDRFSIRITTPIGSANSVSRLGRRAGIVAVIDNGIAWRSTADRLHECGILTGNNGPQVEKQLVVFDPADHRLITTAKSAFK